MLPVLFVSTHVFFTPVLKPCVTIVFLILMWLWHMPEGLGGTAGRQAGGGRGAPGCEGG